jgi:hypothetical protein
MAPLSAQSLIVRWPQAAAPHFSLLKDAGIEFVLDDNPAGAVEQTAQQAGIGMIRTSALPPLVDTGLWPGISGEPKSGRGDEVASASRDPWVNANGYLVHGQLAKAPGKPVLLAHQPDEKGGLAKDRVVPFETLELALAEARVYGGNFVLAVDPRYREGLLAKQPKALDAWRNLGRTAKWLKENAGMFGQRPVPAITAVLDSSDHTLEFANLMVRRGANPYLVMASNPPKPNPAEILTIAAAGIKPLPAAVLEHARAGSTLIVDAAPDPAWHKAKSDRDRDWYSLGRGQVLAYHETIEDPSEYALDVIDVVTHKRRAVRLWNASAAVPLFTMGRVPAERLLHIVNYGSPVEQEVQARVQGQFSKALLMRPEAGPSELKIYKRGSMTEVFLPNLAIVATVRFIR